MCLLVCLFIFLPSQVQIANVLESRIESNSSMVSVGCKHKKRGFYLFVSFSSMRQDLYYVVFLYPFWGHSSLLSMPG